MSLAGVLCVCVAAALVPAISAKKTAMSRHQLELKEHYEHLATIAEFHCELPQPRLLTVQELLPQAEMRGKAYFPEVTLLHRCDRHVGSCNDGSHQCGPTHAAEVKMVFKVTYLEEMDGHAMGSWKMEYYTLQNHTACGCLKYEAPPPKTTVHIHYVDPSLVPPQNLGVGVLPLEPSPQIPGNLTSYGEPAFQYNITQQSFGNGCDQAAEGTSTGTCECDQAAGGTPTRSCGHEMSRIPEEEGSTKPNEETSLPAKPEQQFPGYPGYNPSEEPSGGEERESSTTTRAPPRPDDLEKDKDDADATTITPDLVRFGSDDTPRVRSAALKRSESPYDTYLRIASS